MVTALAAPVMAAPKLDVSVSISADPAVAAVGETVTYTVEVTSTGNATENNLTVTAGEYEWFIKQIKSGGTWTESFTAVYSEPGEFEVLAAVTAKSGASKNASATALVKNAATLTANFPGLYAHVQVRQEGKGNWETIAVGSDSATGVIGNLVFDRGPIEAGVICVRVGRDALLWYGELEWDGKSDLEVNVPTYTIEIPEGFSGVGIKMICGSPQWPYQNMNAGDSFTLINGAINNSAYLHFTYRGNEYTGVFELDGSNPFVIAAEPSASVEKLQGNQNTLTVTVSETICGVDILPVSESFNINNNSEGAFEVGGYSVYVKTYGNTKISDCCIV